MKRPSKDLKAVLRAWRPTLPGEMAASAPDAARSASQLVAAVFAKYKLAGRLNEVALMKAWVEAVGPFHAQHTVPRAFRDGVLTVTVSNSMLLAELRTYAKPTILRKLRERLKPVLIRDISFRYDG